MDEFKMIYRKKALYYLYASLTVLLISIIYELFSNGIYSVYMLCAFLFTLMLGFLPYLLYSTFKGSVAPVIAEQMQMMGIITLTVGSFFRGALEIFGNGNPLIIWYYYVGVPVTIAGIVINVFYRCKPAK